MKRLLGLLMVLPLVASCSSLENDYYSNDYRHYPSVARVERPHGRHYNRSAPQVNRRDSNVHQHDARNGSRNTHGHSRDEYDNENNNQHGHN